MTLRDHIALSAALAASVPFVREPCAMNRERHRHLMRVHALKMRMSKTPFERTKHLRAALMHRDFSR